MLVSMDLEIFDPSKVYEDWTVFEELEAKLEKCGFDADFCFELRGMNKQLVLHVHKKKSKTEDTNFWFVRGGF